MYRHAALLALLMPASAWAGPIPTTVPVSIPTHDAFFNAIRRHCGKAFEGKVSIDNPASPGFEGRLVMHVRKCTDTQLQIPFHVGDDRSRTWLLSKTGSGLQLKHDHRHEDGSSDQSTMYGGHTLDAGWAKIGRAHV